MYKQRYNENVVENLSEKRKLTTNEENELQTCMDLIALNWAHLHVSFSVVS